jgi:FADH2 O2-dependent halogenase
MSVSTLKTDVCILGAGFGGSLLALILRKLGRDVVLIDKGRHPRFAIGESSTPIGNRILFDLCRRYGLSEIEPLCKWGAWQKELPHLRGGLKRGFSYFFHEYDKPFEVFPDHRTELLVSASAKNEHSDTHWLRADVDRYFCECAVRAGAAYFEQTHARVGREGKGWRIDLTSPRADAPDDHSLGADDKQMLQMIRFGCKPGESAQLSANYLIHAAGPSVELAKQLDLGDETANLRTCSRGLFAHFSNITPWADYMQARGMSVSDHPYPCDDAAVHQVFPGGWMWQLRFAHQVVSAGFSLKEMKFDANISPEEEFSRWLARLPGLDEQMRDRVRDLEGPVLTRTGRMQRLVGRAAGEGFWLLPFSAGFISPLQSTGIAHTLAAVERIARYFSDFARIEQRHFAHHDAATRNELLFIDELISLCYETTDRPELFHLAVMTYFAAVTTYEKQRAEQGDRLKARFIGASDDVLRDKVREVSQYLRAAIRGPFWHEQKPIYSGDLNSLTALIAHSLKEYDHVGLFKPKTPRMYEYTAAPEF